MYQSLEECCRAWEKAGKHGSVEERIERNKKWLHYYKCIAKQRTGSRAAIDPRAYVVSQQLKSSGLLHRNAAILDIGSGTGAYALAFAEQCAQVTALDMEEASLGLLEDEAHKLGRSNIRCIMEMWEQFSAYKKYTLTFSSMCPAICNYEELLRMESITEEACCLIAAARGAYDPHRRTLMQQLDVRPQGGMTTEAIWYYEMLYLMGRKPDVKSWTHYFEYDLTVEEACRRNEVYFEIFDIPREQSRPVLQRYFGEVSNCGMVHEESHLDMEMICWSVPQKPVF